MCSREILRTTELVRRYWPAAAQNMAAGTARPFSSKTNLADLLLLGDVSCLSLSFNSTVAGLGQGLEQGLGLGHTHNVNHNDLTHGHSAISSDDADGSSGTSGGGGGGGGRSMMVDDDVETTTVVDPPPGRYGGEENSHQVTTTGAVVVGLANIRDLQRARDIRVVKGRIG